METITYPLRARSPPLTPRVQGDLSSDGSADSDRCSDSDSDAAGVRSDGGSGERDPLDRRETLVCDRLQMVMHAMTALVGSRLEGRSIEKLVSSASRIFRAITKVGYDYDVFWVLSNIFGEFFRTHQTKTLGSVGNPFRSAPVLVQQFILFSDLLSAISGRHCHGLTTSWCAWVGPS